LGEEELYSVVDYILNHATTGEIEVIVAALKKRLSGTKGPMGLDPSKMAQTVSDNINEHIYSSLEQVHENIRGYVRELIKREEPDIPEEHLRELVDTWTPDPRGETKNRGGGGGPRLPPDVLLTMVKQFLAYSRGGMSVREQQQLREEIPDWQETYWRRFPLRIKKLLSLVLKGTINEESFWDRLTSELDPREG
jgi:hypothetical protein